MSTSRDVGFDEDVDPIKAWQDPNAYPPMPKHFITCPLNHGQLHEPYSMDSIGLTSFYLKQEKAMVDFFTQPPFTKPVITSPPKKAKASMASVAPSTMETRVKVMRDFIGFTTKWLHLPSTMEHVLNPQVVAKYFGYHEKKGSKGGYMKNIATHFHQVAHFVTSGECPLSSHAKDKEEEKAIMDWYTNINGHLLATLDTHIKAKEKGITLWSVWLVVISLWDAFLGKLKVRK